MGEEKIAYVGHSFLYLPECPIPLLGEDLTKLNAQVTFSPEKVDTKVLLGQACPIQAVHDNGETNFNQKYLKKFYKR